MSATLPAATLRVLYRFRPTSPLHLWTYLILFVILPITAGLTLLSPHIHIGNPITAITQVHSHTDEELCEQQKTYRWQPACDELRASHGH